MEELNSNSISDRDYNSIYASASSGNIKDQIKLGFMYREGDGVEKDGNKAMEWFTRAADQGSAKAQSILGDVYSEGEIVVLSYSKALAWYTLAADQGDLFALTNLGLLYERGFGVPRDYSKAAEYYAQSAAMGEMYGQCNLGELYREGKGVPKDEQKAFELISKSAEQGHSYAQELLGEIYFERHDYEKGKDYLRLATEQGNQRALEKLQKIEALQEKYRKEDSIKKVTCPFCDKQTAFGKDFCAHCSARIYYHVAKKFFWCGGILGAAGVGYGISQGGSFIELMVAFVIPWTVVTLFGLFFEKRAVFVRS